MSFISPRCGAVVWSCPDPACTGSTHHDGVCACDGSDSVTLEECVRRPLTPKEVTAHEAEVKALEAWKSRRFVLQARAFGIGWADVSHHGTEAEAKDARERLLADEEAWMSGTTARRSLVRIVDSFRNAEVP